MTFAVFITIALQRGTDYSPPCGRPEKLKNFKTLAAEIPKARDAAGGFTAKITYEVMDPYSDLPDTREGALIGRKDDLIIDLKYLRVRHTATTLTVIDVDKKTFREFDVNASKPASWRLWSWLALPVTDEAGKAYAVNVIYDGVARMEYERPKGFMCIGYPFGDACGCRITPIYTTEPTIKLELASPSIKSPIAELKLEINPDLGVATVANITEKSGVKSILRVTDLKKDPVKPDPFKAFDELKAQCKKETP